MELNEHFPEKDNKLPQQFEQNKPCNTFKVILEFDVRTIELRFSYN